ncbi:MAG: DUF433 domain-containing protein [Chitinophagaceae bacterium]|nr:DUF433 domain-containing protein [Chitinophagaceae bacterium]
MDIREIITIDSEILGEQTVFKHTRVPVETLFDHLEAGISLNQFLEDFPTVTKEKAIALLNCALAFSNRQ